MLEHNIINENRIFIFNLSTNSKSFEEISFQFQINNQLYIRGELVKFNDILNTKQLKNTSFKEEKPLKEINQYFYEGFSE